MEAEHGTDSSAVLVSPDRAGLEAVAGEVIAQVAELPEPRRSFARSAITNGGLLAVADLAGMAPHIVALAGHEGFPAHAAAMTTRFAPSGG